MDNENIEQKNEEPNITTEPELLLEPPEPQEKLPEFEDKNISKNNNKLIVIIISSIALLSLAATVVFLYFNNGQSFDIPNNTANTYKIKLIDAYSEKAITNADVEMHNEHHNIVCIKSPCPQGGEEWSGKSDKNGFIYLPDKYYYFNEISVSGGYTNGSANSFYVDNAVKSDGVYLLDLEPNNSSKSRVKIIEQSTSTPILSAEVWLSNDQNCILSECTDLVYFGKTNKLGNLIFNKKYDNKIYYAKVEGYISDQSINFSIDDYSKGMGIYMEILPNDSIVIEGRIYVKDNSYHFVEPGETTCMAMIPECGVCVDRQNYDIKGIVENNSCYLLKK